MSGTHRTLNALTAAVALVALALLGRTTTSGATFTSESANPGTVTSAPDWTPPTVSIVDPGPYMRGTTTLTSYAFDDDSGVATVVGSGRAVGLTTWNTHCSATTPPWTCTIDTTRFPDGLYDVRAVATDHAGYSTESIRPGVRIDNTAPTGTILTPDEPFVGTVYGTASLEETGSGMASVLVRYAPLGTTNWTSKPCEITSTGAACVLETTLVPDGMYEAHVVATDKAGNVGVTPSVIREVRNRVSSVALTDIPLYVRGTTTFNATASSNMGVTSVTIQHAGSTSGPWTDLCTRTASPYSCTVNSNVIPDGARHFRAVMVEADGHTSTSWVMGPRTVDNSPVHGVDIQAQSNLNALFGSGDVFLYTYDQVVAPGTIRSGWNGTGGIDVVVRVQDTAVTGRPTDSFNVFTDNSWSTPVNVGTVEMGTNMTGSPEMTFNGTISQQTVTVNGRKVTQVRLDVGSWRWAGVAATNFASAQLRWFPSTATRDLHGIATSAAVTLESGPLDRDI